MSLSFNGNAEFKPNLFSSACYLRGHWPECFLRLKTLKTFCFTGRPSCSLCQALRAKNEQSENKTRATWERGRWRREKWERGQESKTMRKMAQVKSGKGWRRKETLADKPLDLENRPLGLSCLSSRTDI